MGKVVISAGLDQGDQALGGEEQRYAKHLFGYLGIDGLSMCILERHVLLGRADGRLMFYFSAKVIVLPELASDIVRGDKQLHHRN